MRRSANTLLHSIKDQVRNVRYTIRAEAEVPGSGLPKSVGNIDLGPFIAIGSVVGTPALKVVDGIFTQVESFATEVMKPKNAAELRPATPISAYFDEGVIFSERLYGVFKNVLQAHGVRNALISEHALDQAQAQFRARHGDVASTAGRENNAQTVRICAGLTCALADARPIRKFEFAGSGLGNQHFMLSPNIYCSGMIGLMTALVTLRPELLDDVDGLRDSADCVVNARFDRFKCALSGKSPIVDLAKQFEAVLPFMP